MKRKFSSLANTQVLEGAKCQVALEREAVADLLEYLYEVDLRKIHLEMAYPSLIEFCRSELKLSDSQSYERARAVGAMKTIPIVRDLVHSGAMSPTNAAILKRAIDAEELATGQKTTEEFKALLVEAAVGSTKREFHSSLEKLLTTPISRAALKEKIFHRTSTRSGIQFEIDIKTEAKIKRARELVNVIDLGTLFDRALEALIEKEEKKRKYVIVSGNDDEEGGGSEGSGSVLSASAASVEGASDEVDPNVRKAVYESQMKPRRRISGFNPFSRIIPAAFKASIALKSGGRCEYVDPKSKRRCTSRSHLQIDHRMPLALGGKTELGNLRHLCGAHNRYAAVTAGISLPLEAFKIQ